MADSQTLSQLDRFPSVIEGNLQPSWLISNEVFMSYMSWKWSCLWCDLFTGYYVFSSQQLWVVYLPVLARIDCMWTGGWKNWYKHIRQWYDDISYLAALRVLTKLKQVGNIMNCRYDSHNAKNNLSPLNDNMNVLNGNYEMPIWFIKWKLTIPQSAALPFGFVGYTYIHTYINYIKWYVHVYI